MRAHLIALLALLSLIAVATFGAISTAISTGPAKTEIADRISTWMGRPVQLRGEPVVRAFPHVGIEMTDVTVSDADQPSGPPIITSSAVEASLKTLPLLTGRVEVKTLTLEKPHIRLVGNGLDSAMWDAGIPRRLAALFSARSGMQHGEIILRDGMISYEDRDTGDVDAIRAANLRFSVEDPAGPTTLSGSFLRGETRVTIDARLDDPEAVFSGSGSRGHLILAAELTPSLQQADRADREGSQAYGAPATGVGSIQQYVADRLGMPAASGLLLGPVHLTGNLQVDQSSVRLSDAVMDFHGNAVEGALSLELGSRQPQLQGSLAFTTLQAVPYIKVFLPQSIPELMAMPVSVKWLQYLDADIEVSVDQASLNGMQLSDAIAKVDVHNGQLAVSLNQAGLDEGNVKGRVKVKPAGNGIDVEVSGRADDVSVLDVARAVRPITANNLIYAYQSPQGEGAGWFDLSASGRTIGALVESLTGQIAANVREGSVRGADIVSTLESLADGDSVIAMGKAPFIPVAGWTYFDELTARASLENGMVRAERVRIAGDRYEIVLRGRGDLVEFGEIEAEGVASLFEPTSPADNGGMRRSVELPFGVGGTVHEPAVAPGIPRILHRPEHSGNLMERFWQQFASNAHDE